jgi:hypothetical protein
MKKKKKKKKKKDEEKRRRRRRIVFVCGVFKYGSRKRLPKYCSAERKCLEALY